MKKLLLTAFLGLALSFMGANPVDAGCSTFGLFTCGSCNGGCNGCGILIRPYNAFTPVLCGLPCGGGCQQGCGQGGCNPSRCAPGGCNTGGCNTGGCAAGGCASLQGFGPYANNPNAMVPPAKMPVAYRQPQNQNQQQTAANANQNRLNSAGSNVYPVSYYPMPTPAYYGYYNYGYGMQQVPAMTPAYKNKNYNPFAAENQPNR